MTRETKQAFDDRFMREMTETAEGMLKAGVTNDATHKLTMRELNRAAPAETISPLTGSERSRRDLCWNWLTRLRAT
jgi:hypothetical protein